MHATIERIDRYPIELPFREVPERNMDRELPHWRYFEIFEVELDDGSVGHGEQMLFYSWGETTDEDVERARGANAAAIMWDDSLGPGLQMALFDAVARALDAPIHALIGDQVREAAPIGWWCIDMPAADWVAEAERAHEAGYTNLKVKGRPWWDLREQLAALDEALPESFNVDVDFNGSLRDAERGLEVLADLQQYPQLSHVEGPIPQSDVEGNRDLTAELDVPTVIHYGTPDPEIVVQVDACDGFVVGGGASEMRDEAAVAAMADRPFWFQLVGSGITAAYSMQFGAVFEQATWPAINCFQLFADDLLVDPIEVADGRAPISDAPGLGFEVDVDAVERYRVEKPDERPNPPRLVECDWPDGPTVYLAESDEEVDFVLAAANDEELPYFERGVETRLLPEDGTDAWRTLHERAREAPVVEDEPVL